jgi:uncharacterized protein (TIRG00374 family)
MLARVLPRLVLSLVLGGLLAWLAARRGLPLIPPAGAFRDVHLWTFPVYALTVFATNFVRAIRWRHLVQPIKALSIRDVLALNWIGFFAIFILPLRLGEVARPGLGKVRHGISLSAGFGTVAVERVLDGLITSACVVWALAVLPRLPVSDPVARALPAYGYAAVTVFAAAFVALNVFLWQHDFAVRATERILGIVSPSLGRFVASKVSGVADGVRSIGEPRLAVAFVAESLVYWTFNALGMWLLAWGCGLPLGLGHAFAVMGILAIGILLPSGPGLFGSFQLAVFLAIRLYVPEDAIGSAGSVYVFALYTIQAIVIMLTGILPLYVLDVHWRDLVGMPIDERRPVSD